MTDVQHAPMTGGRLRSLLVSPELAFLMEAHDGLSARIAEAEGFEAIWASSLAVSTALGTRDSDETSWSQLLDVVEYMVDASGLPILIDGNTGFGNFNTARRFVAKAERIGAAGVCFEDKRFPKMNSFVGDRHPLADVHEFMGTIRACMESRETSDFCVVARTEALVAGLGVDEALRRAYGYAEAGADAVFVHSKQPTGVEIEEFARQWDGRLPLVIAPTTYASTPTDLFREWGIGAVIWANHSLRAAAAAMRRSCRTIRTSESVMETGVELASLPELFELMHYDELETAERRFLGID